MSKDNTLGERMVKIETDIEYIKQNVDEIKDFIKLADNKYACKQIEKEVENIKLTMAKYVGMATGLWIVIQLILKFVFKV